MFKKLNESFHRMFLREAASDENVIENDVIKSLEKNLREVALAKLSHGITNIKDYEYAFQDTIESFFPARAWWEVTDCNIFWTLFETKSVDDTIDEIINGIKPEFRVEYKSEEIIEVRDDADVEAERAINAREAEYGADGSRVFKTAIGDDIEIKESKKLRKNKNFIKESYNNEKIEKIDDVRKTYMKFYPSDELGLEIESRLTFKSIYDRMKHGQDFYDIVGVGDSIIRERIFEMLANVYGVNYNHIYNMWLGVNESFKKSVSEAIGNGDKPYTYKQMYDELKSEGVLDKDKGAFSVGFKEEKEHCKKILDRKGFEYELSLDDRTNPPYYHFEYWKKPLKEDTVKQGSSWVNKGKEGTHGKFRTKKEADAQRKAMFVQGYKESVQKPKHIANEAFGDDMRVYMNTWANYNEYGADLSQYGIMSLKDGWMTIDDALEFCEEHAEDEPFINDTDNIPSGLDINEYSNAIETLEKLQELEGLDIDDDLLDALTETTGSIDDAIDVYESGDYEWYPGISSYTDLAYEVIEQLGGLKYAVSNITNYIDENAMRRDYEYGVRDIMYDDAKYEVEKEHRLDDEDEYDKDQEIEDWIDNNIDSYLDSIISEEISLAEMGEVDLSDYFDYEAYGRDLSFDDYYIANTGAIRVF